MMGKIYKSAGELIVYLGDPLHRSNLGECGRETVAGSSVLEPSISTAIEFLRLLAKGERFHQLPYFAKCASSRCPSCRNKPKQVWHDVVASLKVIAEADWFNRTWTIQEIVLARPAIAMYGRQKFPWKLLEDACVNWNRQFYTHDNKCIMTLPKDDYDLLRTFSGKVLGFIIARHSLKTGQPFVKLLLMFSSKVASEDRDKIYALLGLQSERHAIPVTPDIEAPAAKVFIDFAVSLINSQDWIVPLHLDLHQELPGMPSWIPDWTYCNGDLIDYRIAQFVASFSYKCSIGFDEKPTVHKDHSLEIVGISVDSISKLSGAYRVMQTASEQVVLIDSWRTFENLHKRPEKPYIGGGTVGKAHHRTLFADRFHDAEVCRQLQESDVDDWYEHLDETRWELRRVRSNAAPRMTNAMSSHVSAALRRRLFISAKGYIGLCPETCVRGDAVFVLARCPAPIFLRHQESQVGNKYKALGHGYVDGLMNGEAIKLRLPFRQLSIV